MQFFRTLAAFTLSLSIMCLIGSSVAKSCGWGGENDGDDEIITIDVDVDGKPLANDQSMVLSPKLQTEIGNELRVGKDYEQAFIWYMKAAKKGYREAQNNLAGLYELGFGVPKDLAKAVQWYQLAAQSGEPHAQHSLGVMYAKGRGVESNVDKARSWLIKSTDQKHLKAFSDMATIADDGPEKLKWLLLAVHHGDSDAKPVLEAARAESSTGEISKAEDLFKQWLAEKGWMRNLSQIERTSATE